MSNSHTHPRKDDLGVFWIPANVDTPMEYKIIENTWRSMGRLVGGYCESVSSENLPELSCGCSMVMIVNEDGLMHRLPPNERATALIVPDHTLVGDVFLIGLGLVADGAMPLDRPEVDLFSLPPEFNTWEGPGHPIPTPVTIGE